MKVRSAILGSHSELHEITKKSNKRVKILTIV